MQSRASFISWCRRAFWLAALVAMLATAGYAGKVKTVLGKGADFAHYKTYTWLPTRVLTNEGIVENEPSFDPIVRASVNRELTAKGLVEVKEGGDLQVAVGGLTASTPQVEAIFFPGVDWTGWSTTATSVGRYNREGTLVVNLIDAKTKKSAWAAMATENLGGKGSGLKKVDHTTTELFKKYPKK